MIKTRLLAAFGALAGSGATVWSFANQANSLGAIGVVITLALAAVALTKWPDDL